MLGDDNLKWCLDFFHTETQTKSACKENPVPAATVASLFRALLIAVSALAGAWGKNSEEDTVSGALEKRDRALEPYMKSAAGVRFLH